VQIVIASNNVALRNTLSKSTNDDTAGGCGGVGGGAGGCNDDAADTAMKPTSLVVCHAYFLQMSNVKLRSSDSSPNCSESLFLSKQPRNQSFHDVCCCKHMLRLSLIPRGPAAASRCHGGQQQESGA
jgi:hypothetical protein